MSPEAEDKADLLVVGGGAAGLMVAVQAARLSPDCRIVILDGAKHLGAKILISGGGRCNVTNAHVDSRDFHGGSRNVVKRLLKAFSAQATVRFFDELGVPLHEEEHGKLFPDSHKARTVLTALVGEAERLGVRILANQRVEQISVWPHESSRFQVQTAQGSFRARRVVLATGGKSVPKTGSDGSGYELARALGHSITPTFPALVPMLLAGDFHSVLSGISLEVELTLWSRDEKPMRWRGSLLWTHFGVSGPVVLDLSRHWHAAELAGKNCRITCNSFPGETVERMHQMLIDAAQQQPHGSVRKRLAASLPNRFVEQLMLMSELPLEVTFGQLTRPQRQLLVRNLMELALPVEGSRGFGYAEATAGGVPLAEVSPSTLESRCCPGLFLAGEVLDVDGRLGGFNFQWAWSSGTVAAQGAVLSLESESLDCPAPPG